MRTTIIKPSPLHGKGLFALKDFSIGELVEVIDGEIILAKSRSKYSMRMSKGRSLILTNKTKFINHSLTPNVEFNINKAAVYAIAAIAAGEELTCEYESPFTR